MNRIFEPSTWAGLSAILAAFASFVPGESQMLIGGASAAAGTLAVYLRENHA